MEKNLLNFTKLPMIYNDCISKDVRGGSANETIITETKTEE